VRWLLAVGAAAALAPAASAGLPNPCTLLTNAEVAKAFGTKIATRTSEGNRYGRSCAWDGVARGTFTSAHASLRIDLAQTTKADFLRGAKRAKNAVPLQGLGDLAYSEYMAGEFISVWQRGVSVGFDLTGVSTPIASANALAHAALARLP